MNHWTISTTAHNVPSRSEWVLGDPSARFWAIAAIKDNSLERDFIWLTANSSNLWCLLVATISFTKACFGPFEDVGPSAVIHWIKLNMCIVLSECAQCLRCVFIFVPLQQPFKESSIILYITAEELQQRGLAQGHLMSLWKGQIWVMEVHVHSSVA